jgi:hypothetical protein
MRFQLIGLRYRQPGCRAAILGLQFAVPLQIIRNLLAHALIGQKQHPRNFAVAQAVVAQQHRFDPILDATVPLALVANQKLMTFLGRQNRPHDSLESWHG